MRKVREGWTDLGNGHAISPLNTLRGSVSRRLGARGALSFETNGLAGGPPQVRERRSLPADGLGLDALDRGQDGLTLGLGGCGHGLDGGNTKAFLMSGPDESIALAPEGIDQLGVLLAPFRLGSRALLL